MFHLERAGGQCFTNIAYFSYKEDKSISFTYDERKWYVTMLLSLESIGEFTKITEGDLFLFVYRLFHEDFSPIIGTNFTNFSYKLCSDAWHEIVTKQSANKYR